MLVKVGDIVCLTRIDEIDPKHVGISDQMIRHVGKNVRVVRIRKDRVLAELLNTSTDRHSYNEWWFDTDWLGPAVDDTVEPEKEEKSSNTDWTREDLQAALELRSDNDAGDNISIREYLQALLLSVWREGEYFDGKRPFGNSDWHYDLYKPLVETGIIYGKIHPYGYIEYIDDKKADALIIELIKEMCRGD